MYTSNTNSPLETLAAFAIVAAASVVTTLAIGWYTDWVRHEASGGQDGGRN